MKTVIVSLVLTDDNMERLKQICNQYSLTMNDVIATVLEQLPDPNDVGTWYRDLRKRLHPPQEVWVP